MDSTQLLLSLPGVRAGWMFGHRAYYVGRKMFACDYAGRLGLKLPPARAAALVRAGRAEPFRPYGRPAMRCWVSLSHREAADRRLLMSAVAFVKGKR
jgi:hypothetical protein